MTNFRDTNPATLQDALDLLRLGVASFEHDPAENDFQKGYEHALLNLLTDLQSNGWSESLRLLAPELKAQGSFYSWGRIGEAIS
jgi:hypothetical protein